MQFRFLLLHVWGKFLIKNLKNYFNFFNSKKADLGTLNIYTRQYKDGYLDMLWSKSGNQGEVWIRHVFRLNVTGPFQIVIEGTAVKGPAADLALDDTIFSMGCQPFNGDLPTAPPTTTRTSSTPNPCAASEYKCETTPYQCIRQNQVCDFTPNCMDASDELNCGPCDFESGK